MRDRRRRGLTLLEVTISAAILISLILVAIAAMVTGLEAGAEGGRESELAGRGRQTIDRIRFELQYGRILDVASDHARVRFQIPVDTDGTLGYYHPTTGALTAGFAAEMVFEANQMYREPGGPTIPVAATRIPAGTPSRTIGANLNGDMDQTDGFALGRLFLSVYADTTFTAPALGEFAVDDQVALRPNGTNWNDLDGDVDGDGTNDPLFQLLDSAGAEVPAGASAARVRITVWHMKLDERGDTLLKRRNQDDIRLENSQS